MRWQERADVRVDEIVEQRGARGNELRRNEKKRQDRREQPATRAGEQPAPEGWCGAPAGRPPTSRGAPTRGEGREGRERGERVPHQFVLRLLLLRRGSRGFPIERRGDARGERGRRTLVGQVGTQRRAHGLETLERCAALGTALEMPFEGGGREGVELAVEISVQAAFGLSAGHRVPPR